MRLSEVFLCLFVFFVATVSYLAWFTVDAKLIGWVGLIFVAIRIFENFHAIVLPLGRRRTVVEE